MQVKRACVLAFVVAAAGPAAAQDASVEGSTEDGKADDLDLRLTLSSFLYRESGSDADPLVANGAAVETASPVRRYFADLRAELSDGGLQLDGRIRQTTSQRYQSGAGGGGEYELRRLSYRLGGSRTQLVVGRQLVDAVGSTKLDGAALVQRLGQTWSGTLFGGAFPALGSRSLDTDYPRVLDAEGKEGAPLVPLTGGFGIAYSTPRVHGDLGLAAVYVMQSVPEADASERSRVFATASGYARPGNWLDVYHFLQVDVAGNSGASLTNGSLGLTLHPTGTVQLSAQVHHVSTELLQIAARNLLADPDPNAIGIVQNDIAVIRVSQDVVRAGASVALAKSRFEVSASGGLHRRPGVDVPLADGGSITFAEVKTADTTITVLDRSSVAGLRASASATITFPIGNAVPRRARGGVVRVAAGKPFLDGKAEVTADVMVSRFRDAGTTARPCEDSMDVFACFSTATTGAAQAGALGSYRLGREWLFLLDAHVGVSEIESITVMGPVTYPRVLSVTSFARVQWRYR